MSTSDYGLAPAPVTEREVQVELVLEVITDHRRLRNVRACSGCEWRPEAPGGTDNPEALRRRHQAFNLHLAELAVQAVAR